MVKMRLVVAFVALIGAIATAKAQDWPSRPVRFIVPFPAGGSTDVGARLVGEYLSRSLRQQIVVENKSGANGNIGIETAAKAPADGYRGASVERLAGAGQEADFQGWSCAPATT